ncbi:oxidized purine nucleoside triphosphate hydrolase-like [Galleria mellonella]|uniref:Oxidized purine nucleoside triphosphate hydrolase n=1 Tax=Galleria mellonella TaxID=7137 RepID=A0A6J3C378_GALME|nr:oxidized purine nucleoside triphosphate hydrolase-like [Galleria mellonella]
MLFKKVYTLIFVRTENQILLGLKKRGFGVNKWNGFGGKVEQNELIVDGAARELKEECCLDVKTSDLKNIAHLEFTFEGEPLLMDVRVFSTNIFEGTPAETEEMSPKWFNYEDIPFNDMWPDDRVWFPYMLKGKLIYGRFHYKGLDTILDYKIQELESMEAFYADKK